MNLIDSTWKKAEELEKAYEADKIAQELIDDEGNTYKASLMIGSDGVDGVSRKFVVGSNSYIKKRWSFRIYSRW